MSKTKKANRKPYLAIVCAYRGGGMEPDLNATINSAIDAAGDDVSTVYPVEDKTLTGPGHNRHRGIEAAKDREVICIIDAHMRFAPGSLARMAADVRTNGGLIVPLVHHNEKCDFTGNPYSGATMTWKASDGNTPKKIPLVAKWRRDPAPGACTAVMGACYLFRRDWYYSAGCPLDMLRAWGGDEEALSIAAWLTGERIECVGEHVAHLYRAQQPWPVTPAEKLNLYLNRWAILRAFVPESDRAFPDLSHFLAHQTSPAIPNLHPRQAEIERVRLACLRGPRTFDQWRREACDGAPIYSEAAPKPKTNGAENRPIACPHCAAAYAADKLPVSGAEYPNGNRPCRCRACGKPFIAFVNRAA